MNKLSKYLILSLLIGLSHPGFSQLQKDQTKAIQLYETNLKEKLAKADKPNLTGKYKDNVQSLMQYQTPEWYKDAKFGIFIHWGVFSVPAINDCWYGYWMYRDKEDLPVFLKDHPYASTRAFQLKHYGTTDKFGYKDLIPLFKGEYFNAEDWVRLFKLAGAKYVVPVAEMHDLFPMYDCSFTDYNAKKMGPKKDIVGLIRKACLDQQMKFGVSSHRMFHQDDQYYVHNGKNDIDNPKYWDLYGPPFKNPKVENPLFIEETLARTVELVNKYQPDLLWFDAGSYKPQFKDIDRKMAAHYYNQAEKWKKPVVLNYKYDTYPEGAAVLDLEASKMDSVHYPFWQTDMSMADTWSYSSKENYKTAEELIHSLIDIVSKNGSLLLNISPRADGLIPLEERDRLKEIGAWLKVNGEAIYGPRPFKNYGEGPTKSTAKMVQDFTSKDIRYTTKGKILYAVIMGWPDGEVKMNLPGFIKEVKNPTVTLLGETGALNYKIENKKISVQFPSLQPYQRSSRYAYVLKLAGFNVN